MPNYSFRNNDTNEEFDLSMTYEEKVKYLQENPNIISIITKPLGFGDSVSLGRTKPDQGFRDVLREIKKKHPRGGGVNTF